MYRSVLLLLLALVFACASASDVLEGHTGNFKEITADGLVLVEFYAPWCGHCKKLAPEWEKAATLLKGQATLVKVDATVEADLGQQFGVRGYPTIKVFNGGVVSDYEGGRTAEAIVQWVQKRLSPPVELLDSAEAIQEFKLKNAVAIILYTASNTDDAFVAFESQAKTLRDDYTFGAVFNANLYDGNAKGSIVLYKQFDEGSAAFTGDIADQKALAQFASLESFQLVAEIGADNYKKYIERAIPILWLFVDPAAQEETSAAKTVLSAIAAAYKGKLSFVYLDGTKYPQMVQKYGHSSKVYPVLAIDNLDAKYYAFKDSDPITKDLLSAFVDKFVAGTLERTIKSEPVPDPETVDGLTTIVGSRFEEIVMKSNKDVLVEFYAPWCGHCKSLAPIYQKLALTLKDVPTLTIGQMDATANDPSGPFDVQGFPTLYFVPAGKEPLVYEGQRTAAEMLAFIKKHATNPVGDVEDKNIKDEF